MKSNSFLLLGCGDIGSKLGLRWQAQGAEVLAVRRTISKLPAGLPALALDYCDASACQLLAQWSGDSVLMTPTPMAPTAQGYRRGYVDAVANILALWSNMPAKRIVFVSSTRVYGDHGGDWVDENSALTPGDESGAAIVEAERQLLASHHQVAIVRCGGIYGRLPNHLLQRLAAGRICPPAPVQYTNRIHRDDCIGFLQHLFAAWQRGEQLLQVYLAVDDDPAEQWEVENWLAAQLGVTSLEQVDANRRGGNKRCRNTRLHNSGYQLAYPDYRAGYRALLDEYGRMNSAPATPPPG